jgi:predicted nucleic acid-binding protein
VKRYVTDTQCLLWHMAQDRHLPKAARSIFAASEDGRVQVLVPSIVLVETVFLLQRQRIKEAILDQLLRLSEDPHVSIYVVPLDMNVVQAVTDFGPASVPELADRVIAATARALGLPLLTTDPAIAESGLVEVIG